MGLFESDHPLGKDEVQDDPELSAILRQWRAPRVPRRLRQSVFPERTPPWWKKAWATSIRVPLPLAIALAIVLALGAWRGGSRTVIKTQRVEVPVIQERIITNTVYRDRIVKLPKSSIPPSARPDRLWRPVTELRPRIIPPAEDKSPND